LRHSVEVCRFVTIGFERKSPNFFAASQPTGDWGLVMWRTSESRDGGGKGAARKILRRDREVTKHGAEPRDTNTTANTCIISTYCVARI